MVTLWKWVEILFWAHMLGANLDPSSWKPLTFIVLCSLSAIYSCLQLGASKTILLTEHLPFVFRAQQVLECSLLQTEHWSKEVAGLLKFTQQMNRRIATKTQAPPAWFSPGFQSPYRPGFVVSENGDRVRANHVQSSESIPSTAR